MRLTISSTRSHWRGPTCEGPRHAAPMQKRVLPDSRARTAAWAVGRRLVGGWWVGDVQEAYGLEIDLCSFNSPETISQADPMPPTPTQTPPPTSYTSSSPISFSALRPVSSDQWLLWLQ
jgi:hypothetical protein